MKATQIEVPDYIVTALESACRPATDRQRDAKRKPGPLLAFFDIAPGQAVGELMAGLCYVTSIVAEVVGQNGVMYSTNSEVLVERFKGSPVGKRIKKYGLINVREVISEPDDPQLPSGELDAVLSFMIYHDMVWSGADRPAMNTAVFNSLKPGGIYAVMDHHAPAGAGTSIVQTKHRIEKQVVVNEILAAGFELEDETDLLENPQDLMDIMVHEKGVRDCTSRFVLKFRKPG